MDLDGLKQTEGEHRVALLGHRSGCCQLCLGQAVRQARLCREREREVGRGCISLASLVAYLVQQKIRRSNNLTRTSEHGLHLMSTFSAETRPILFQITLFISIQVWQHVWDIPVPTHG